MKLDLAAIAKLSPAGLIPLAELRALISVLIGMIKLGVGNVREAGSYAYMLVQHEKKLREQTGYNHRLKIKAWVKQCPERTAWVRSVIGEATIGRWVARLRAAYTAPRMMGDGFAGGGSPVGPGEFGGNRKRKYGRRTRKAFALVRMSEVEKLLPFRPRWPRNTGRVVQEAGYAPCVDTGNVRHAARLRRPGISNKTQHPRPPRGEQPVRFFPSELGVNIREPDAQQATQKYGEDPPPNLPKKPGRPQQARPGTHDTGPDNPPPEKPP